jgi:hypothetical protein
MALSGTILAQVGAENEFFKLEFDQNVFRLIDKACGKAVIADGRLADPQNTEITAPAGVPFVLITRTLHNRGAEPLLLNQVPLFSAAVALTGELVTVGTGGLLPPAKNPGSYAWLAIADRQTRRGVVGAWLTHDRGSGVVFSPATNGVVRIAAQVDYGRLRLKPGASERAETFVLGCFADARLGLEAYADAVAKHYAIKLPPQPAGFCTWYTDKYSGACDERHLPELAAFAAKELKPFGFEFVQIDDKWQDGVSTNGPKRGFMNVNPQGPYPGGMKAAADGIAKLGLKPGIWFIPFAGTSYDPFFASHPEWFYKDKAGMPFEARWGGTCLDMSVPGAREYLSGLVRRIAHEWGYKVFKMDGLWTGTGTRLTYVNNGYVWDQMGEAAPADPDKTQIECYRDGLKLVRKAAGPDVFLLGCCVSQNMRSFGASFGLVDAMRVGPDTGSGRIGAPHASRNYFLQGRVWQNDPDCVSVRAKTLLGQARVNACFTAITGDLFYNSDWMPDLPAERLEILKRTMPAHNLPARPVDYFESDPARIWHLPAKGRDVVALFNWDKVPAAVACALDRIGLPKAEAYVAFDFWKNQFLPPFSGEVKANLLPGSCRVLAIRPVADHPQLLSTSRHITQGVVDVLDEKWDAATRTLSGVSRVVASDPYELRVVVPVGDRSYRAAAPATQDGPNVRMTIGSRVNGEVKWAIAFEPGRVEAAAPLAEEALPVPAPLSVPKERPPMPPAPEVYLDSLQPLSARNGWGKLAVNTSVQGQALRVGGNRYEHGIGCHADSLVVYKIPAGAKRFVAVVGLDDEKKSDGRSSVTFEVYGDVKEMGEEPELLAKSPVLSSKSVRAWALNAELTERHKELRLVVTDAGDGNASDHADWVDAGFATK